MAFAAVPLYSWFCRTTGFGGTTQIANLAPANVLDRRIDPCMSEVFPWEKIPHAHELMRTNRHPPGNMAVLVNAPRTGLRTLDDAIEAGA